MCSSTDASLIHEYFLLEDKVISDIHCIGININKDLVYGSTLSQMTQTSITDSLYLFFCFMILKGKGSTENIQMFEL